MRSATLLADWRALEAMLSGCMVGVMGSEASVILLERVGNSGSRGCYTLRRLIVALYRLAMPYEEQVDSPSFQTWRRYIVIVVKS